MRVKVTATKGARLGVLCLALVLAACGGGGGSSSDAVSSSSGTTTGGSAGTSSGGASTGGTSSGDTTGSTTGGTSSGDTSGSTSGGTASAGIADDGLLGWATVAAAGGSPTGGFSSIVSGTTTYAPVSCTADSMKTLRDCLYRSKKSGSSNDDSRYASASSRPDWSKWEVHNGVTGGWKNYPVVIYLKGRIVADTNDSGTVLAQADYEAGTDPLCTATGVTKQACQQAVTQAKLERGNIAIIGLAGADGSLPTFHHGWLLVKSVSNVIVRNVRFVPNTDFWPSFEACSSGVTDKDYCSWNAEPDGLTILGSTRVWVDHCDFTDGAALSGAQTDKSLYKYYDGLLDIKSGSDYVTVSYSKFYNHHKAMLIGSTDTNDGSYRITFHHNYIKWVNQRMPRVRNGQVHIFNNLYEGPKQTDASQQYYFGYAIGLGYNAQVYSERNAFDITGAAATDLISANFDAWAQYFTDVSSWLNGSAVDLNTVAQTLINAQNGSGSKPFIGAVSWAPTSHYSYSADTTVDAVRTRVAASAGVGKVSPVPTGFTAP
ncbi:pectate lyase family protein [Niveibacterium terrae]|uniref:pectate lyase family protein n=1 Tax=Niveibacterium terrae TaxID=3373598 RepID=UPI003A93D142